HAASVRPEPGSNSPNKNHLETIPKHQSKTDIKKTPHPQHGAPKAWQKQQQTKTTKHTIEFSNNTPPGFRQPRYYTP
ncbi:MAG: hypothetical protein WBA50_11055, partial [Mycobacterium sp.]